MPDIYIPNVRQVWAGKYGWAYEGTAKKFILHSTETDSAPGCVDQLCRYLDGWANPHVVWDPWTGDMAMCGRADWAGGALVTGNKDGSVVLQVEAVGWADGYSPNLKTSGWRPFADSPMLGWDKILAWADSWGIPRTFPAGKPIAYPESYGPNPQRGVNWDQSGYFAHSQVAGNVHGDPGIVDLAKIFSGTPQSGEIDVSSLRTLDFTERAEHKVLSLGDPQVRKVLGLLWAMYPQDQILVEPAGSGSKPLNPTQKLAYAEHEVRSFQKYHGLVQDGIVGPITWQALVSA